MTIGRHASDYWTAGGSWRSALAHWSIDRVPSQNGGPHTAHSDLIQSNSIPDWILCLTLAIGPLRRPLGPFQGSALYRPFYFRRINSSCRQIGFGKTKDKIIFVRSCFINFSDLGCIRGLSIIIYILHFNVDVKFVIKYVFLYHT